MFMSFPATWRVQIKAILHVFTLMKCKRCSVLSLLINALTGSGNVSVSVSVYLGLKSIVDTLSITVLRSRGDNSIDT